MSRVTCHLSHVTDQVSHAIYSFFLAHEHPKFCKICHACADYSTWLLFFRILVTLPFSMIFMIFQLILPVLLAPTDYCFDMQAPRFLYINLKLVLNSEHTSNSLHLASLHLVVQVGFGYFCSRSILLLVSLNWGSNFSIHIKAFLVTLRSYILKKYDMPLESSPPSLICAI